MLQLVTFLCLAIAASALRRGRGQKAVGSRSESSASGKVFTLGDSYSSGVGIHKFIWEYDRCPDNPEKLRGWCCRDYEKTAGAQYAAATPQMQSVMLACGGSEMPNVNQQLERDLLGNPDFAENRARGFEGDVIHFTIGGNDIRSNRGEKWGGVLARCIAMPSCQIWDANQIANFDTVESNLYDFYKKLATNASKAHIRAMAYPKLMNWDAGPLGLFGCNPVPGVSKVEANWGDAQLDELNRRIRKSVARVRHDHPEVDFEYVPVDSYLTKGSCTRGGHVTPIAIGPHTFHPTPKGYDAYFRALRDSLQ